MVTLYDLVKDNVVRNGEPCSFAIDWTCRVGLVTRKRSWNLPLRGLEEANGGHERRDLAGRRATVDGVLQLCSITLAL